MNQLHRKRRQYMGTLRQRILNEIESTEKISTRDVNNIRSDDVIESNR
jgi:uncharacterized protein YueI